MHLLLFFLISLWWVLQLSWPKAKWTKFQLFCHSYCYYLLFCSAIWDFCLLISDEAYHVTHVLINFYKEDCAILFFCNIIWQHWIVCIILHLSQFSNFQIITFSVWFLLFHLLKLNLSCICVLCISGFIWFCDAIKYLNFNLAPFEHHSFFIWCNQMTQLRFAYNPLSPWI